MCQKKKKKEKKANLVEIIQVMCLSWDQLCFVFIQFPCCSSLVFNFKGAIQTCPPLKDLVGWTNFYEWNFFTYIDQWAY